MWRETKAEGCAKKGCVYRELSAPQRVRQLLLVCLQRDHRDGDTPTAVLPFSYNHRGKQAWSDSFKNQAGTITHAKFRTHVS